MMEGFEWRRVLEGLPEAGAVEVERRRALRRAEFEAELREFDEKWRRVDEVVTTEGTAAVRLP